MIEGVANGTLRPLQLVAFYLKPHLRSNGPGLTAGAKPLDEGAAVPALQVQGGWWRMASDGAKFQEALVRADRPLVVPSRRRVHSRSVCSYGLTLAMALPSTILPTRRQ